MFRKFLGTVSILLFMAVSTAHGQSLKVGYMNPQEVLAQLPERAQIEQQLNDFVQQRQMKLQERINRFQQTMQDFAQDSASMSQERIQQRRQELSAMEQNLVQYRDSVRVSINQKRAELMQPIYNRLDQAIATVAEARDLDFVLNKETTAAVPVLYSTDENLNITQEVLEQMKSSGSGN